MPYHKLMDKIFEQNIIKQDSRLCTFQPGILQIILRFLPPTDVVHLSHTCKELHQKLPFYLIKSGDFTVFVSGKSTFLNKLFEGPAINFSVSKIKLSVTHHYWRGIVVWIQIIRSQILVLETQKYVTPSAPIERNFQFTKKDAALREYKPGDMIRFMASASDDSRMKSINCIFQVSLQLENYDYGKPINVTKKAKGFAEFKSPSVFMEFTNAADRLLNLDRLLLPGKDLVGGDMYLFSFYEVPLS